MDVKIQDYKLMTSQGLFGKRTCWRRETVLMDGGGPREKSRRDGFYRMCRKC